MESGRAWGFVFFLFLSLGALTTIIAVFECLIGGLADELRKPRILVTAVVGSAVSVFALPTVLFKPLLEWEDFVFGQFWLPVGALLICVFVTRNCGWGYKSFSDEASAGAGMCFPSVYSPVMKWLVPILVAGTMVAGLVAS